LLKGADISARDFNSSPRTAFGLACRQARTTELTAEHASQISETLRILLNNGHDIVISHEVDDDLYFLFELNDFYNIKGLLRMAVAILNNYLSSISCDGLLRDIDVHRHTQECLTFYTSELGHHVDTEDITLNAIARLTPQTSQAVFLKMIDIGRDELVLHIGHLTTKLVDSIGGMHYKALVWIKDDRNSWKSTTISPLELASRSIATWDTLRRILENSGVSWLGFIEDALKMPDCQWCPDVLRALSEINWLTYDAVMSRKWPKFHTWLMVEVQDSEEITLDELFQWDKVLADLKQNEPLRSIEIGILQRLDRFACHMSHHEDSQVSEDGDDGMTNGASNEDKDSEASDEKRDSESSDEREDSESSDEEENSESLDEDEEVDLYSLLQEVKNNGWEMRLDHRRDLIIVPYGEWR
jgi:hypothetical protein